MHLPNDILALQQAPGLSENDAASIDHLPGLKSLKMRVRHWGTAPYVIFRNISLKDGINFTVKFEMYFIIIIIVVVLCDALKCRNTII